MACTVIPTEIPTIDKTAIPTNKYQQYQPRGGGMIPIPEKWLVSTWYATLVKRGQESPTLHDLLSVTVFKRDFARICFLGVDVDSV